ncbi:MAG: putative Fe-S cluster assembly protein SufT [Gammaproteobacteria bacterium]|nr:putative Fe-S cluster assembly protein SufT [Gammaproteobacteria bacterium]
MERRLIAVGRPVEARLVPTGTSITIPDGVFVTLTQALGGTYTVVYKGNMARIEAENADALGFEPEVLAFEPPSDGRISSDQVWQALRTIHDPEIPVNVVDLGLIYDVAIARDQVDITMTLTAPGCGMGPVLVKDVEERVSKVPHVQQVAVDLVFDPPWSRDLMSEEAQLELGLF